MAKLQESSITSQMKLDSVTTPIAVSSVDGNLRNSVRLDERLTKVRNQAQEQGMSGSCGGVGGGWGN